MKGNAKSAGPARAMYHPTLGRWLQRDPLGYADSCNVYEYVVSRPVSGRDPEGLACDGCRKTVTADWEVTYPMDGVIQRAEWKAKVDLTVWERDPAYTLVYDFTWKGLTATLRGKKWTPCNDGVRTCYCSYRLT